jgi:hypothetical protein
MEIPKKLISYLNDKKSPTKYSTTVAAALPSAAKHRTLLAN